MHRRRRRAGGRRRSGSVPRGCVAGGRAAACAGGLRGAGGRVDAAAGRRARGRPGDGGWWVRCAGTVVRLRRSFRSRTGGEVDMSRLDDWTAAVALDLDLAQGVEQELVLDVARDVAHAVARPAAPLTSYLMGLAVAGGLDPHEAARRIRELAAGWDPDRPQPETTLGD